MEDPRITNIKESDIKKLLELFAKEDYNPKISDPQSEEVLNRCIELWKLDYEIEIIPNEKGEFCDSYPTRIPIPVAEVTEEPFDSSFPAAVDVGNVAVKYGASDLPENVSKTHTPPNKCKDNDRKKIDSKIWKNNISKSNVARCWNRFPVPVLLIHGKYISRSATISATLDVGLKSLVGKFTRRTQQNGEDESIDSNMASPPQSGAVYHIARLDDVKLLKMCGVSSIIDFMVEKKKQKYLLNVSSSEKVDLENRYKDFSLYSMPYPGCEFFKKFKDRNLNSEDLHHSWNEPSSEANEAKMNVPKDISLRWSADWQNYKSWDVRTLTDNYVRVILDLLMNKKEKGLLLHCISGWDRTPLFISLIRLILWGEGRIHNNFNSLQILYFTLGYDWYLFKHKLNTRISNGEHILYFCFEILSILSVEKHILPRSRSVSVSSHGSSYEFLNMSSFSEGNDSKSDPRDSVLQEKSDEQMEWPFQQGPLSDVRDTNLNADDFSSIRLSPGDRNRNTSTPSRNSDSEDDEVIIMDTSLSPVGQRPSSSVGQKSPFGRRNSANRMLDYNLENSPVRPNIVEDETRPYARLDNEGITPIQHRFSSPLPVPGREYDAASESYAVSGCSSWSYVTKDAKVKGGSWDGLVRKKDGGIYEKSIGSSLGSASSFLVFDKPKRLKKVRLLFYKLFGEVGALNK